MKFDFNDILLQPESLTKISSRNNDVVCRYDNGYLPLFTAPMDTVVNLNNVKLFNDNGIKGIIPRTEINEFKTNEFLWKSYGLSEFEDKFIKDEKNIIISGEKCYALIDVANGHMEKVFNLAKEAKKIHGNKLVLMVGNIATPHTYELYAGIGVDYIRIGIGNGNGCLTTVQTGIGYPMASLVVECRNIANRLHEPPKIVADGGFKSYSDVIKALALGADYVMLGSIFNKAYESCGDLFIKRESGMYSNTYLPINQWRGLVSSLVIPQDVSEDNEFELISRGILYKNFRGMSTKEAQKAMGNSVLKTSEGVVKYQKVEYTLAGWVDNFEHYLKSAMSYTNSTTLKNFIGNVEYNFITENSFKRFNK